MHLRQPVPAHHRMALKPMLRLRQHHTETMSRSTTEEENDHQAELAAWELLRDTLHELEELRTEVRNFRDVSGRHNTVIAYRRLIALLPESKQYASGIIINTP